MACSGVARAGGQECVEPAVRGYARMDMTRRAVETDCSGERAWRGVVPDSRARRRGEMCAGYRDVCLCVRDVQYGEAVRGGIVRS